MFSASIGLAVIGLTILALRVLAIAITERSQSAATVTSDRETLLSAYRSTNADRLQQLQRVVDALVAVRSGLELIRPFCAPDLLHTNKCNGGDDGPCDCESVRPLDVVDTLLAYISRLLGEDNVQRNND